MQKITVVSVEPKNTKTGGQYYVVTDDKGGKFSGFHEDLAKLQAGSIIEAEIEVSGKYHNVKEFKILNPGKPAEVQQTHSQSSGKSLEDRISIERQVCLKCACEIAGSPGTGVADEVIKAAEKMYQWLSGRFQQPAKSADQQFDDLKSAGNGMPATIKTGADLFNYAMSKGMKLDAIKKTLSGAGPADIKDVGVAYKMLFG